MQSFKPSTIPEIRITEATTENNKLVNKDSSSVLRPPLGVSDVKREAEDNRMLISSSGSPLAMKKKNPVGAMANGEAPPPHTDQTSGPNINIWSPFGKSSISPLKTYKPVTFSPFSSSPSTSLSSSLSSFSDTPVKSSAAGSSSAQQTTSKTTASMMNGIATEGEAEGNTRNDGSSTHSSSLQFSPSSTDGRPMVSSSVSDWKPPKPATSAKTWKPPVAASTEAKSSTALNPPPSATASDGYRTVSFSAKKNSTAASADSNSAPSLSTEWKPVQVVTTSSVRVNPPSETPSAGWKKFQVSDNNSSDGFRKSPSPYSKAEAIDTTIFDRELTEDWWDSLFNEAQKAEAAAAAAEAAAAFGGDGHHINADDLSYSRKATEVTDSEVSPLSSTAAVLRLSSSLGDAIQTATDAELMSNSHKQTAPSTQQNRGPRKPVNNDILEEWRSGFSDNNKNSDLPTQHEYDRLKELHETQRQSNHRKIVDGEVGATRMNGRVNETTGATTEQHATKDTTKKLWSNVNGLIPVKFEGIGPTEEKTGVPIATRVSIDEKNRKDWYRRMYASLNKPHRPPGKQTLNGDTREQQRVKSPSPPGTRHPSYYPPHASYNPERDRYRNQPLRIEDYEPGYHCSIALKDRKSDPNRFFESDAEVDYRSDDLDAFTKELLGDTRDHGQGDNRSDRPGNRKKGTSTGVSRSKSFNRQKRDEENQKRKLELETVMAEERRRRFTVEQKENEARRHQDSYTPVQKTTFLLNRFSDDEIGGMTLQRPKQVKAIKMRGKAKAVYTFKAQSNRELSFKKGDTIYLLRQLDKNWYQGEHNGIVGIFPIAYVEVITSLEEAKTMALQREGKAIAKFNFKAKTTAELSLQKGDVVRLIRKADPNWYEGRIGHRQGIFPINFVETVQEPDAPMMTPSPSTAAPTPMPETSGRLSPTSSLYSGGPDIPSAPVSPWNSDFYESEFEPELRELSSKARPNSGNKTNSIHQKTESTGRRDAPVNQTKQTTYFTFPINGKPTAVNAAPATLAEKSRKGMRSTQDEKDLFTLARKRRANAGTSLEARSASLGDDLEKILRPTSLEPLGKSLSFDLGPRENFSKGPKSSSSSRYTALYDYKPKNLDELELKEGDVVCVMEKCDDGWFVGFSETTSEFGTFPGNYVERLF